MRLRLSAVSKLVLDALKSPRVSLNHPSAAAIAKVITAAERDGAKSHGLFRLPGYCAGVLHGKVDPLSLPIVEDRLPSLVHCDAQRGYAPVAFERALPLLADKAKRNGIAALCVQNSFHFGALWFEAEALARHGLASLVFVNSKSFVAQPGGNGHRLYGTNPMAFGLPRPHGQDPLVIDQASSVMARGEIQMRCGSPLPEGVGIDTRGQPSTDPEAVLAGAQLPFGGIKGANIALMVEVMAAGLTGSPFAFEAHDLDPEWYGPTCHGMTVLAIDPTHMGGHPDRTEELFERLAADGGRVPGSGRIKNRMAMGNLSGGHGDDECDDVEVEIECKLYEEILHITNGGDNWTQGYK